MKSLRAQLVVFWILLAVVGGTLGLELWVLYRLSANVQIDASRKVAQMTCESIALRYAKSVTDPLPDAPPLDLLQVVLHLVLIEVPHVEGGVWSRKSGFLAYAYPTYEGSSVKRDVPEAEQGHIADVAAMSSRDRTLQTDVVRASREAMVVSACPLNSVANDLVAWTMTRTPISPLDAQNSLRSGLGVLLVFVLASGVWLGLLLVRGYRHVHRLERQMDDESVDRGDGPITPTGVLELDRVVMAINRMRQRIVSTSRRLREYERQQARDQRLAALGRMTGSIAHEIRNPIAAMRLKAENALAGSPHGHAPALEGIVGQIDRLDGLVKNLLAVVQPMTVDLQVIRLDQWLETTVAPWRLLAEESGKTCILRAQPLSARVDALHLGRAIDNLLDNALRHARREIVVSCRRSSHNNGKSKVTIRIHDDGPGIPESLHDHLFEPFASGRRDGTGLGLALAREVALAHGGELRLVDRTDETTDGTCFEIELPWHES